MKTLKFAITLLTALALFPVSEQTAQSVPRLILQITVDQLRGDLPSVMQSGLKRKVCAISWKRAPTKAEISHQHHFMFTKQAGWKFGNY